MEEGGRIRAIAPAGELVPGKRQDGGSGAAKIIWDAQPHGVADQTGHVPQDSHEHRYNYYNITSDDMPRHAIESA